MQATLTRVAAFRLQGLTIRTTNAAEQTAAGRIGPLWQQFYGAQAARQLGYPDDCPGVFGVYSAYESDAHGAFDVTAATRLTTPLPAGLQRVDIEAGDYLVFHAKGPMPQAVLTAWQAVWQAFGAPRADYVRRYQTDFEHYVGPDEVALHIGVSRVGS
jgi:predicted transcriptional regulator YdeE